MQSLLKIVKELREKKYSQDKNFEKIHFERHTTEGNLGLIQNIFLAPPGSIQYFAPSGTATAS